jgi:hypothetical protein
VEESPGLGTAGADAATGPAAIVAADTAFASADSSGVGRPPAATSMGRPTTQGSQATRRPPLVQEEAVADPLGTIVAVLIILETIVAVLIIGSLATSPSSAPAPASTANDAQPTTATTQLSPSTTPPTTSPPTTVPTVSVPKLVGMPLGKAKSILADHDLHGTITYKTTSQYPSGIVIAQSRKAGTSARPGSSVTLVVAKAPPPPPPPTAPPKNCDPAYPDRCLQDGIGDWDCAGGTGNGPNYVDGPLTVLAPDPFDLDRNHDGVGCEEG